MDRFENDSGPFLTVVSERQNSRNALGRLLRQRRRDLRMTQEALAARFGVRPQTVSGWESGTAPQTRFHADIAAFLELAGGASEVVALLEGGSVTERREGLSGGDLRPSVVRIITARLQDGTPDDKRTALYHDLLKAVMELPS